MGPFTQLLELQVVHVSEREQADAPPRPHVRLPVSGTLLAWSLAIPTLWTGAMVAFGFAVRW